MNGEAIAALLAAAAAVGYATMSGKKKKNGATPKNFTYVTTRPQAEGIAAAAKESGTWLMILGDAAHESALRTKGIEIAKANPTISVAVFYNKLRVVDSAAWGIVQGMVFGIPTTHHELLDEEFRTVIDQALAEVLIMSGMPPALGAAPSVLLQIVGLA